MTTDYRNELFGQAFSLLALKLLDEERRSQVNDFSSDEALGLFASLNVLPKKTFQRSIPTGPGASSSGVCWPRGSAPCPVTCSPRRTPSLWTSTRSRTEGKQTAWSDITSPWQ